MLSLGEVQCFSTASGSHSLLLYRLDCEKKDVQKMFRCKLIQKCSIGLCSESSDLATFWNCVWGSFWGKEQVTKMDPSQNKCQETCESVSEMKYIQRFFCFLIRNLWISQQRKLTVLDRHYVHNILQWTQQTHKLFSVQANTTYILVYFSNIVWAE